MSRMLSKMNLISVVQQLPKEDIETIQGYVEMIEKENQELKKQLECSQTNEETYYLEIQDITKILLGFSEDTIFDEVKQYASKLKKQNQEYKRLGFKHLNDKCTKLENQQKEFIEYMTKTIEECNNYSKYIDKKTKELHGRSYGKTYIANEIMKNEVAKKILKETLSKYKEIICSKGE